VLYVKIYGPWDRLYSEFYDCTELRLECLASDVSWLWGHVWNPTWQSELVHITHSYHMRLHQQHHHTLCNMLETNTTPPKFRQKIALFVIQCWSAKSVCYVLLILWLVDDVGIKMKIPALAESLPIILEEVVTRKCRIIWTTQKSVYY